MTGGPADFPLTKSTSKKAVTSEQVLLSIGDPAIFKMAVSAGQPMILRPCCLKEIICKPL